MRKINAPPQTVREVIACFEGRINNVDLYQRLVVSLDALDEAEEFYQNKGVAEALFLIPEGNQVGTVTLEEMKGMYSRFSRPRGAARHIYDAIKLSSPGGICPLCGQRTVSTLDHYLAKSRHAALTVTPANLVPACKDCNTDTQDRRPASANEQTLHPYYDTVDDEIWLVAQLQETTPPSAMFSVVKPEVWTEAKFNRVLYHFETFRLGILYSIHAAGEIVTYALTARRLHQAGGAAAIKAYFQELAQYRRIEIKNTWQAALCQCLADSDWYCNGGFATAIPVP